MKLKSIAPSYKRGEDLSTAPEEREIKWQREILRQDAVSSLEMEMYPFKKVTTIKNTDSEMFYVHCILNQHSS